MMMHCKHNSSILDVHQILIVFLVCQKYSTCLFSQHYYFATILIKSHLKLHPCRFHGKHKFMMDFVILNKQLYKFNINNDIWIIISFDRYIMIDCSHFYYLLILQPLSRLAISYQLVWCLKEPLYAHLKRKPVTEDDWPKRQVAMPQ